MKKTAIKSSVRAKRKPSKPQSARRVALRRLVRRWDNQLLKQNEGNEALKEHLQDALDEMERLDYEKLTNYAITLSVSGVVSLWSDDSGDWLKHTATIEDIIDELVDSILDGSSCSEVGLRALEARLRKAAGLLAQAREETFPPNDKSSDGGRTTHE
jgi:phage gp29-like protein